MKSTRVIHFVYKLTIVMALVTTFQDGIRTSFIVIWSSMRTKWSIRIQCSRLSSKVRRKLGPSLSKHNSFGMSLRLQFLRKVTVMKVFQKHLEMKRNTRLTKDACLRSRSSKPGFLRTLISLVNKTLLQHLCTKEKKFKLQLKMMLANSPSGMKSSYLRML